MNKAQIKKIFSIIIAVAMVIGGLPQMTLPVFAEDIPLESENSQDVEVVTEASEDIEENSADDTSMNESVVAEDIPLETWQEAGVIAEDFDGNGTGSELDPFIIKTAGQLAYLAMTVNNGTDYNDQYISLTSNINLAGKSWIPIGNAGNPFAGTFNGNGYVISNVTTNDNENDGYEGLFGYNTGVITKVGVKNVNIHSNGDYAGGFVGYNEDVLTGDGGQIINCYVMGGTVDSTTHYSGGFIGYNHSYYIGIEKCYSTADVKGLDYVGGFGGYNEIGNIYNSFATGTAMAIESGHVSGFANGDLTMMYHNYYVDNDGKSGNDITADTVGNVEHINSEGLYGDNLLSLEWDKKMVWDIISVWETVEGDTPELLTPVVTWEDYADNTWISAEETAGRDGSTEAKAYQVHDAGDLAEIAVLVNKGEYFDEKFIKIADGVTKIDLAAHEWKTIGSFVGDSAGFSGTFDGNNAEITHMTISERSLGSKGLFGSIARHSTIKNIKLTQVSIMLKKAGELVGCVAAINVGGIISNVTVSGNITGDIIFDDDSQDFCAIGGIAGMIVTGKGGFLGLVEQCASYVDIDVNNHIDDNDSRLTTAVGGIVGGLYVDSTIQNCYNRGDVLVKIALPYDSYSIAGGICGTNFSAKTVKHCYNTGIISAINTSDDSKGYAGQIVGDNCGAVKGCFYDSDVLANESISAIGYNETEEYLEIIDEDNYAKTASEMKNQSTYEVGFSNPANAWDFVDVWKISSENDGYPILKETTFFDVDMPPVNGGGGSHSSNNGGSSGNNVISVEQDGKATNVPGKISTQKDNGLTTTTIAADDRAIQNLISKGKEGTVITLPLSGKADVVIGQLNGQTVKDMENKEAVLEIKTNNVTYTLPASEINIEAISAELGLQVALKDIKVNVTISAAQAETVKVVQDMAKENNYQIVVNPVEFEITCANGTKTIEVSKFNGYVERIIAIPDGVDPNKITTGIVFNPDGTFSHVPTAIVVINGKYYAKINSLTNSTYSVIYNQVTFNDVANHWGKDAIEDMGARLVISGVGNRIFEPDREITRGECAAIIVRALGLKPGMGSNPFTDVNNSVWYADYIKTATDYQLISGYGNNQFGPMDPVTREQAMAMIARAMKLTGLNPKTQDDEVNAILADYTDGAAASAYARKSLAECLKSGVLTGRNGAMIAPKDDITRAEIAVLIQRLLQNSNLIN